MTESKHNITVSENAAGQSLNRRLYMQLHCFGNCTDIDAVSAALESNVIQGVVYADLNDPQGIAVLACHEDAEFFVDTWRKTLNSEAFTTLVPKPELTMIGRTYAIGYERNLEHVLLSKPLGKVTNADNQWAIWYPLRRKGAFQQLPADEKRAILMEHGDIGRAYGEAGHGTDIRLACHGLDKNDNDYVIALLGKELTPLSKIVERMRLTKQTSEYLEKLGPFFVGRVIWQSKG